MLLISFQTLPPLISQNEDKDDEGENDDGYSINSETWTK